MVRSVSGISQKAQPLPSYIADERDLKCVILLEEEPFIFNYYFFAN